MDTPVSRVMILARDRSLAERLHAALHTNNPALQTVQSGASCIVLGMREEELGELHSTISSVRTRHKGAIIAAVPFSRRARELAGALVDAVVWHDEIDDSLRNLVGRYRHNSLQHRFARALASAVAEDRQLALGLRRLCTLDPPAILVEDGLAALGLPADTARRRLHAYLRLPLHRPFHRLLAWIRLLWMCDPIRCRKKLIVLSVEAGRDVRTLQRTAVTLAGRPFSELRSDPEGVLQQALSAIGLREP